MQTPKKSHLAVIKQILQFIQGTVEWGIMYKRGGSKELIGYSDSSHNIDEGDGRSTTGHVFNYGGAPISWCSQKQRTVALSSCEAEYMAASSAAGQAVWLGELLAELTGRKFQEVLLKIDNTSTIALECVEQKELAVEHISGKEQRADILTKALARVKFDEMRRLLGVEDLLVSSRKLGGDCW
ncbi:secreted RxLR effector protein 161-like [Bidens hawaiensis]|uniref:secreted RxLR effector protein 161-like n=1 Tax=Bidens hawaiensis TaxID=980011 RepID=UPI0040492488